MADNFLIEPGLAIYKQTATSRVWWVRTRVNCREVRQSLKTHDRSEAIKAAYKLKGFVEYALENGYEIKGAKTYLSDVIKKVISNIESAHNRNDNAKVIIRVLNSISDTHGKTDAASIDNQFFISYYNSVSFNATLLANTNTACNAIIDYLEDQKLNDRRLKLPKRVEVKQSERYDHFEQHELDIVLNSIDPFIGNSTTEKTEKIRTILKVYIHFLLLTGARPGNEVFGIKFSDISLVGEKKNVEVLVNITKGKTRKRLGREIKVDNDILPLFDELCMSKYGLDFEKARKRFPNEHVFYLKGAEGEEKKPYLERPFLALLEYAKKLNDIELKDNHRFAFYSFRHTYITNRLLNSKAKISEIAAHTGTSTLMIETRYSHIVSRLVFDNLESDRLTDEERAMKEHRIYSC